MSKGSRTRPLMVSKEIFDQNWDRIFVGKTQVPFTAKEIPNAKKEEKEGLKANSCRCVGVQQTEEDSGAPKKVTCSCGKSW